MNGLDAILIGPSDRSASLGLARRTNHPNARESITYTFKRLDAISMPIALMPLDFIVAKGWIEAGSNFTAIGVDLVMLTQILETMRSEF